MEEYIDIVTKEGKPTGESALKSEIHQKGHYHNTAHIWFYTKKGSILLAQRAATKTIYPLLWDVSVAGHVDSGETIKQAAIREIQEEIGLAIQESELQEIGVFTCFQSYDNGIIDNEFHYTFIVELRTEFDLLTPQKDEVEALKIISISESFKKLEHSDTNNHFVSSNFKYYEFVFNSILNTLA